MFRRRILGLNGITWIALASLGIVLAWVEFGAMCCYGSSLRFYPSGWPFCHCVRLSTTGRFDTNMLAMFANGIVCVLFLVATSIVVEKWVSYSGKRRMGLKNCFAVMTVASVMFALITRESFIVALEFWQHIGLVPRRLLPGGALTHWAIRHPNLEWCLRLPILAAMSCTVYVVVGFVAQLITTGIERLRSNRSTARSTTH